MKKNNSLKNFDELTYLTRKEFIEEQKKYKKKLKTLKFIQKIYLVS